MAYSIGTTSGSIPALFAAGVMVIFFLFFWDKGESS